MTVEGTAIARRLKKLFPVPKEPTPPDMRELLERIDKLEQPI